MFSKLLRKGLLLRGAMVKGRLSFELRLTKPYFKKHLPTDDTLARAVGLEKMQKGSRFLIEAVLADKLLESVPDWKSHDGYLRSISVAGDDFMRRICPTPDSSSYEYLYYWSPEVPLSEYNKRIKELKDILPMCDSASCKHYEETIAVIERARQRHKVTNERLKRARSFGCFASPI